jgi:hypothetical protein
MVVIGSFLPLELQRVDDDPDPVERIYADPESGRLSVQPRQSYSAVDPGSTVRGHELAVDGRDRLYDRQCSASCVVVRVSQRTSQRSPLPNVLERGAMRLGVVGKDACWNALLEVGATDARLNTSQLDSLISRARKQEEKLERLRLIAVGEVFAADQAN